MEQDSISYICFHFWYLIACYKLSLPSHILMLRFENKEDFILYIGSTNCSHCMNFKSTLEKIIGKYQLDIKYVDISKLTQKEYEVLKNKTKLQGTPTVVFIDDGVVLTSPKIIGAVDYVVALEKFKESGYIK